MGHLPSFIKICSGLALKLDNNHGFDNNLNRQVAQKLTAKLYNQILDRRYRILKATDQKIAGEAQNFSTGGLCLNLSSYQISLSTKRLFSQFFLGLSVLYVMTLFVFLPKRKRLTKKGISLFFGFSEHHVFHEGSSESFLEALTRGKFDFEYNTEIHIVECRFNHFKYKTDKSRLIKTFDLSLYIYRNMLTPKQRLKLLASGVRIFGKLICKVRWGAPYLSCIKDVLLDFPLGEFEFNDFQVNNVVVTPSNLYTQPSFFISTGIKPRRHMIWYSTNSIPIPHKGKFKTLIDLSYYDFIKIDVHYVWTQSHRDFLSSIIDSKIVVVGSMVFYGKSKGSRGASQSNRVLIFDVSPNTIEYSQKTIYSSHESISFIEGVVNAIEMSPVLMHKGYTLVLKPKKSISKKVPLDYVSLIQDLGVEVLDTRSNLYDEICKSRFVICMPYASPAIIAKELGVPVCFFSQTLDFELLTEIDQIPVHQSQIALCAQLESVALNWPKVSEHLHEK